MIFYETYRINLEDKHAGHKLFIIIYCKLCFHGFLLVCFFWRNFWLGNTLCPSEKLCSGGRGIELSYDLGKNIWCQNDLCFLILLRIYTIFRENEQRDTLQCATVYPKRWKNCDWKELIWVWQYMKDWLLCILVYCIQFLLIVEQKKTTHV